MGWTMKTLGVLMMASLLGVMISPPADAQKADVKKAGLKGNPGEFFGPDSYPPEARRAGQEGRVATLLTIDAAGGVRACTVTQSSGSTVLDEATCTIARDKVRFTPATDRRGKPIASEYPLAVRWALGEIDLTEKTRAVEVEVSTDGNAVACHQADADSDRRCTPDIAGIVAMLPKDARPHILDVRETTRFGEVPGKDQLPPPGADVLFLRAAKVFVNEFGKIIECAPIDRKGLDMAPDCPTYANSVGVLRNETGEPRTTWAVMAFYITKRPEAAASPAK